MQDFLSCNSRFQFLSLRFPGVQTVSYRFCRASRFNHIHQIVDAAFYFFQLSLQPQQLAVILGFYTAPNDLVCQHLDITMQERLFHHVYDGFFCDFFFDIVLFAALLFISCHTGVILMFIPRLGSAGYTGHWRLAFAAEQLGCQKILFFRFSVARWRSFVLFELYLYCIKNILLYDRRYAYSNIFAFV